jgi:hypothetical protein
LLFRVGALAAVSCRYTRIGTVEPTTTVKVFWATPVVPLANS